MSSAVFPHAKLDWTISKLEEKTQAQPEDLDARLELSRCKLSRGWMHGGGEADCNEALALARRDAASDAATVDFEADAFETLSRQVSELQTLVRQLAAPRRRKRKRGPTPHSASARPLIAKRRPPRSNTLRDTIAILDKLDMHDAQRA